VRLNDGDLDRFPRDSWNDWFARENDSFLPMVFKRL